MGYQSNRKRRIRLGCQDSAKSGLSVRPAVHGSFSLGVIPHTEEWNNYEAWGIQPEHAVHLSVWSEDLAAFLDQPNLERLTLFSKEQTTWARSPHLILEEWTVGLAPLPPSARQTRAWSLGMQSLARRYQLPTLAPGVLHLAVEHLKATYHGVNFQEGVIAHYIDGPFDEADSTSRLRATVEMAYRLALADLAGMEVKKMVVGNRSDATIVEGRALELMTRYGYSLAQLLSACWETFVVEEHIPPFVD